MEPSVLLLTVPTALGSSSALLPSVLSETRIASFPLVVPFWLWGRVVAPSAKAVSACCSRQAQTRTVHPAPQPWKAAWQAFPGIRSTATTFLTRNPSAASSTFIGGILGAFHYTLIHLSVFLHWTVKAFLPPLPMPDASTNF